MNLEQAYRTRTFAREILFFMSEEVRSDIREDFMKSKFFLLLLRDSRLSRRGCSPKLVVEANYPSVHLCPRPNPLFCLSFLVWRMLYSMISLTMSSTQKTCQSRGPLPLCQILFQWSRVVTCTSGALGSENEIRGLDKHTSQPQIFVYIT